jgi:hypothetical protein
MRCRITSGGGDPRESATENEPPASALRGFGAVRVKRCGKSAPRLRQRSRHGKPHREQDRIGTATRAVRANDNACGSDVRLAVRVGCPRPRASAVPEEWPSRIACAQARAVPYKTRLTGRLMTSMSENRTPVSKIQMRGSASWRRTPRHFWMSPSRASLRAKRNNPDFALDCFASLAMTGLVGYVTLNSPTRDHIYPAAESWPISMACRSNSAR